MKLRQQTDHTVTLLVDLSDDESDDSIEIVEEVKVIEVSELFKISQLAGQSLIGWPRERLLA